MNQYKQIILSLVAFGAALRVAHWSADTRTNEHKALGDLYDSMDALTDKLAEITLGRMGARSFPAAQVTELVIPYPTLINNALADILSLLSIASAGNAQDIINVAADMQAAINHARYFLSI